MGRVSGEAGLPAAASRNPLKMTTMPIRRVTANAVIAPNTEFNVPLAPRISVPSAIVPFDQTSRRGAPLTTARQALHAAPPKMTMAPPADPRAARTRGSGPNTFEPCTSWSTGRRARNGAVTTTPAAKAQNSPTPSAAPSPARGLARRYTVPRARTGTLMIAPKR
jgi:hypothetical protein